MTSVGRSLHQFCQIAGTRDARLNERWVMTSVGRSLHQFCQIAGTRDARLLVISEQLVNDGRIAPAKSPRVVSSAVEHSAFNRLALSSNLRRPIEVTNLVLTL